MRILILNWRDTKNPKSGGAEILTHEIAKSWVDIGHKVTIFSSFFPNALQIEIIDGVRIVRKGHPDARSLFSSVHFSAFLYYLKNSKNFDVVVDEVHGIPFFTPWYVRKRKVVLICEVASNLWVTMFGPIFGPIGRMIEQFYIKVVYKNIPYLTISDSSKEELIKEGVDSKRITVLPMGVTVPKEIKKVEREKNPAIIFVGRLAKSKGIEDAIEMLGKVLSTYPKARLWIVGGGSDEYVSFLKKMAKKLKVGNRIDFFGFVSEEKKFELMSRAHVLVAPSVKEGWGLIVPEAAFVGTPSVVYSSPGLRDVLKGSNYKTIVKTNTPDALADEVVRLLEEDPGKYKKLDMEDYSWKKTAEAALEVMIK
ncbi:MAG: glycosyltransferase family 4 protein [Candidatus Levyibacteriota bacterium]